METGNASGLDEEVECEEEEAQDEEEGAEGETAIGQAGDGVKKARRDYAQARLGARQVERTHGFVTGQIATERGELVFHPEGEFFAVAPKIQGAEKKNPIAEASQ